MTIENFPATPEALYEAEKDLYQKLKKNLKEVLPQSKNETETERFAVIALAFKTTLYHSQCADMLTFALLELLEAKQAKKEEVVCE